ncbi:hypothetical protein [Yersinia ruckeri]|uniref:hypothetical protein n=1 Tax=Yersinia ruckeri TaxID=29486 RepID=UPI002237775F|nr:hypothetical protein [Yersinia ruckeri]MCW6598725.1 hypothetical protein [Yersinia ruckeri]
MTSTTQQERSFLDQIKADLIARQINLEVTLEPAVAEVMKELPTLATTLMGYFTTNTPTLTDDPATYDQACATLGIIQQRLDYASYQYERIHPLYNAIKEQRDAIKNYALINLESLRTLKTADLREAALAYLLKEHNRFLIKMDEIYSLIASVKENLKNAHFTIKLQVDLLSSRNTRYHGAGNVSNAPGFAGGGRNE